ncbi:MAG: exo-alpha-sialidase [Clostridia bacterium]|nr:exo-alpha-sialidase [Clostridia bacterium]
MQFLANDFVKVMDTTEEHLFSYSPGICMGEHNRIIISCEAAGNNEVLKNYKVTGLRYGGYTQGRIFISDDEGNTFKKVHEFPFMHMRPFKAGKRLYILGHCGDLMIIYSEDNGDTWSEPFYLSQNQDWHQAPCNVWYQNGYIYLVMERRITDDVTGWPVNNMAPVLMRGKTDSDLTKRENWTFASELPFFDAVDKRELDYIGVPFFWSPEKTYIEVAPKRYMANIGWLESNVVKINDEKHYLYEKNTFHIFMRAHTGMTNIGCLLKAVEKEDGTIETLVETVPSGKKLVYLPIPGGQMKFHIIYDDVTKLYWLLSTQTRDSMTRAELLNSDRYNLPDNERNKLVLHFSSNCIDWCFAGMVTKGETEIMSRHYASMTVNKDDLYIVSRSGDEHSQSAHNGNFISFHKVENFRKLVY